MRTTLDLPADLIKKVQKIIKTKTKTETIVYSLEQIVRRQRIQDLISLRGKIRLDLDIDQSRERKKRVP